MSKLYVVSRDGKAINDFLDLHGLTKSDIRIVKNASDLDKASERDPYIIINPLPLAYHWGIRPILILKGMVNVTKRYINLENRF